MTATEIAANQYPVKEYHRKCRYEMAKLTYQRQKLADSIERRRKGENVVVLGVDLDELVQMLNN